MTIVEEPRRAWLDAGRAGFLSTPVLMAFLAWSIASTIYIEVIASAEPPLPWLGTSVASSLLVVLILVPLASLTRGRWPDGPGPVFAVVVYMSAGVLRALLLGSAAEVLDLSTSVGLASRMANSAAWSLVVMGSASIVVARSAAHRRLMSGLDHRRRELVALQSTLGERIQQTRSDLVQQVQEELQPTLAQLRSQLDGLAHTMASGVDEAIEGFRTAVADVVRPLSRTLAESTDHSDVASPAIPAPAPPLRAERIPVAGVVAPWTSAGLVLVLLALLALAVAPVSLRPEGALTRVGVLVMGLWAGLTLLRWLAVRAGWRLPLPALFGSLAVAYIVLSVLVGLVAREVTSGLSVGTTTFPALVVALAALAPLAVSIALALQRLARMAELRSAETVAELDILTAALRRELWRERRRLALTVHGPIQSALVAAAVTMSRPGFTAEQVPGLAATLDQAMTHIDRTAGPQPPVRSAARDLASLWVDSALVTLTIDEEVADAIDADEALRTAVVEVMREAVSNAVRHGDADAVSVVVTRPAHGIVRVVVHDDGDGPPMTAAAGLGSGMFDEVALDWSLVRTATLTILEVELGIDSGPERVVEP